MVEEACQEQVLKQRGLTHVGNRSLPHWHPFVGLKNQGEGDEVEDGEHAHHAEQIDTVEPCLDEGKSMWILSGSCFTS